jgi:hypothetical protein
MHGWRNWCESKKSSGDTPCYIHEIVMKVKYETNGHVQKKIYTNMVTNAGVNSKNVISCFIILLTIFGMKVWHSGCRVIQGYLAHASF